MHSLFKQLIKATAAAAVRTYNSAAAEPFANGSTASYVEEMYNAWLRDPSSVHTVSAQLIKKQKRGSSIALQC